MIRRFARAGRVRWMATVVVSAVLCLVAALLAPVPAVAAPARTNPVPKPDPGPAVGEVTAVAPHFVRQVSAADHNATPTATRWPAAATAPVGLTAPTGSARQGAKGRAAGTPVWASTVADHSGHYTGPSKATVRVLDHAAAQAAGVSGVVLSVAPEDAGAGVVRVGLDYAEFAQAYGGNYGFRLRLVQLPGCALSTPQRSECRRGTPLASSNDAAARTVSAQVTLSQAAGGVAAPVVLAATADLGQEGGPGGDYAATTLKPSGSWSGGGSTGSFSYDYPITVPPTASSLVPKVSLDYDSSRVDGQTAVTQAQASWVGDGWGTPESYVEQTFVSCSDKPEGTAAPESTGDMCYAGPVLTLSLNGSSTSLVWDTGKSVWKAQDDRGEVVKHVTGSNNGSGTYNTDYWTVTERDGTVYSFGLNHLPGWSSGKTATNSVDWQPVYSAHQPNGGTFTDPCWNSSGFSASVCKMAYRWNLDYVTDLHHNAMAYYYLQDTNYYGQHNGASTVAYIRDSHLDHIDYGFTDGHAYTTVPNQLLFGTGPRCVSGTCTPLSSSTKANWPDTPYDLYCLTSSSCATPSTGPSHFSTVRLTSIKTQQYMPSLARYVPIDSYALSQTMPPPSPDGTAAKADGTSATLWLSTIARTATSTAADGSTTSVTLPPVQLSSGPVGALQNRADISTGLPGYFRYRLESITTETGSVIGIDYTLVDPCASPVTKDPATNTSSCYPVYWTPDGYSQQFRDWFNKYVVKTVTQTDPTGGAPSLVTRYDYLGGAAWHYDDNEVVQAKYRTYGQFRGYGRVQTRTGDGTNDRRTLAETIYYRGMSRNNNATVVTLTDSQGGQHEDVDQLAGGVLEATSYLGDGGPVDHSTITSYWVSGATVSRSRDGLAALTANWTAPVETYTRQAVTTGGNTTWQYTETDTSYQENLADPNLGLPLFSYTHTGPAMPGPSTCTATTYAAANTTANLVGLVAETETDSVACGGYTPGGPPSVPGSVNKLTAPTNVLRPDQVVSDTRTFYDDPTFSTTFPQATAPGKGDVTMTRDASGYASGAFTYQTKSRSAYDSYGRVTAAFDGNGNQTTTVYAENSVGLTTGTTITNPLGQATTSTLDPTRGLTLTSTDLNGVATNQRYDPLGRVTGVWLYSRDPVNASANYKYTYQLSNTGITAVTTQKLNDLAGYVTSTTIYDALLRVRQTQATPPKSGRMVTDTFYDSRGWKQATNNGWWDPNTTPNTTLITPAQVSKAELPSQDFYTYDGLGRVVVDTSKQDNQFVSATTTVYNGDRTTTIPPEGGITQTTITDPLGRSVELDQYTALPTLHTPADTFTGVWYLTGGTTVATRYGYDGHNQQNQVVDATGATWTSTYNLLGQVVAKTDPDAGTTKTASGAATSMLYDGNGNLTQATDSRSATISYAYDALNRKTGQYDSPANAQTTANRMAAWVYDNSDNAVPSMTYPIGQLTAKTAYHGGAAYTTTQYSGFNIFGEPKGQTITISATDGTALDTSYTFSHIYTPTNGLLLKDSYPAAGGLPAETLLYGYTNQDVPYRVSGLAVYGQNTDFDAFGRVSQETIGAAGNSASVTNLYDDHTGLLKDQLVTREVGTPDTIDHQVYKRDLSGNITKQTSTRLESLTPSETQCYQYDTIARLTQAWTATDDCNATPTSDAHGMVGDSLGTTSAYWTSWDLDDLGQRRSQTQHNLLGGGTDVTTNYTYNGNNTNQSHTLTSTSGANGGPTTYQYDAAGNMTNRNAGQGPQVLHWNDAGQLTDVTDGSGGPTSYLYDADGNLLIEKNPGATTLYLPNEQITLNNNTTTGVRYYQLPGGGTASRTGSTNSTVTFEITDQHGTPTLYLDYTAATPTWRQYTPYGQPRGTTNTWPDNRGYLNKPTNTSTGLTELGARNYDPETGRFTSLDPEFDPKNPQQLNGYTYTSANPITQADPTGLRPPPDECDAACMKDYAKTQAQWNKDHSGNSAQPVKCDKTCKAALDRLQKNKWKDRPYEDGVKAYLAQQLAAYVNTLSEGLGACPSGPALSTGVQAACNYLTGNSPQQTWQQILETWASGYSTEYGVFDQGSQLTQQLAGDTNVSETTMWAGTNAMAGVLVGGEHDYDDPVTPGQAAKDILGMITDGRLGTDTPDALFGSYDLVYQTINVDPKRQTFTVAFAAYNNTGLRSLTHSVPDTGPVHPAGPNWSSVYQEYYWVVTVPEMAFRQG